MRTIGDLDRLGLVAECHHRQDRAKDLFLCDGHVGGHTRQHRRFQKCAGDVHLAPAGGDGGALALGIGHHAGRPVPLSLGHHRPHVQPHFGPFYPRANGQGFGNVFSAFHHLIVAGRMHDDPAHGRTDLTGVEIDAPANVIFKRLEIGILMHDGGRFSAQFQHAGHHVLRRGRGDGDAGFNRAGEDNLVDVRVGRQRRARLMAPAAQDIDRPMGQAHRLGRLGEPGVGNRRHFRGFDHRRVARGQCSRQRPGSHFQRIVPRDDLGRDAVGFIVGEIKKPRAQRNGPPFDG